MNPWIRAARRSLKGEEYIQINLTRMHRSVAPYMWIAALFMAARILLFFTEGR